MKNLILKYSISLIITLNTLSCIAQGIYFDSLYYTAPNEPISAAAQIFATDSGYLVIALHGSILNSHIEKIQLSNSGEVLSVNSWTWPDSASMIYWYGKAFLPTSDGGFLWSDIFSGQSSSLIKFDSNFDTLFTKTFSLNGDQSKHIHYFYETLDEYIGACVIATNSDTEYFGDFELIRLSHEGEILSQDTVEIFNQEYQLSISGIHPLESGGFLVSGSRLYNWDPFIAKFNNEFELVDTFVWGTEYDDWLPWLVPFGSDQFMITYSQVEYPLGTHSVNRPFLMKFDAIDMDSLWSSPGDDSMYIYLNQAAIQTTDHGIVTCGYHTNGTQLAHLQKWNEDGEPEWSRSYRHIPSLGDTINDNQVFWDIATTPDSGLILCGYYFNNSNSRAWVLKLDNCGDPVYDSCVVVIDNIGDIADGLAAKPEIFVWPNPFQSQLNIQLPEHVARIEVLDIMGRSVFARKSYQLVNTLDLSSLPQGAYFVRVVLQSGPVLSRKVIKAER